MLQLFHSSSSVSSLPSLFQSPLPSAPPRMTGFSPTHLHGLDSPSSHRLGILTHTIQYLSPPSRSSLHTIFSMKPSTIPLSESLHLNTFACFSCIQHAFINTQLTIFFLTITQYSTIQMSLASLKGNYSFPKVILNITNIFKKSHY